MNYEKLINTLQIFLQKEDVIDFTFFLKLYTLMLNHILMNQKKHVVTEYRGKFYDIKGQRTGMYFKMTDEDILMAKNWSFEKHNALFLDECAVCGELVKI